MDGRTVELILIGYVVSLPVVAWALAEILRMPPHLFEFTNYSRGGWIATHTEDVPPGELARRVEAMAKQLG